MNQTLRLALYGLLILNGFAAPACKTLAPLSWNSQQRAPVIFPQTPTVDEVVRAINSNAAPIRQLDTDNAKISTPGFPPLRANLALERPKKFRLRGQLLGPEVDVGSNDELFWMWITVALGLTFLFVQGYEYSHAYSELNLKLSSGIYGSTFFMLTGFHGFHVFVGMLMLLFITLRLMKGHFTPQRHFGFEGAAWYWHFVDVVWLGLYVVVYWM